MTDETTRPEEPEALPALDHDDDPDTLAGDLTEPDLDLSFLDEEEDEDDDE